MTQGMTHSTNQATELKLAEDTVAVPYTSSGRRTLDVEMAIPAGKTLLVFIERDSQRDLANSVPVYARMAGQKCANFSRPA